MAPRRGKREAYLGTCARHGVITRPSRAPRLIIDVNDRKAPNLHCRCRDRGHRGQDKEAQRAALSAGLSPKETMRNDLLTLSGKKAVPVVRGHRLPSLYRTKDTTDLGPF